MRSPLWGLMVEAAKREAEVELHLTGYHDRPLVGIPTLPVAANHVVLKDGTVVSLSAVATARLRPDSPEEPF